MQYIQNVEKIYLVKKSVIKKIKKKKKKIVTKNEKKQIRKNGLGVSVLFQVCVKTIIHETVFLKSWNTFPQHTHLF